MIRSLFCIFLGMVLTPVHADAIGRYINIANNIPKMEMKADPEAQAWARSGRNILNLTSETIAESLMSANTSATQRGAPLFCLPANTHLSATDMNNLIQKTYREISSPDSEKENITVSQVALLGMVQQYPCGQQSSAGNVSANAMMQTERGMMHMSAGN